MYRKIYTNNQNVMIIEYRLYINWNIEIVGDFKLI